MAPFNFCSLAAAVAALALTTLPTFTHARLQVAQTLGSHMVLQRAPHRAAIYGHADPFARVAVGVRRQEPPPPPPPNATTVREWVWVNMWVDVCAGKAARCCDGSSG